MAGTPLAKRFLSQLPETAREAFAGLGDLEARLAAALGAAREAWPQIAVSDDAYLGHLARHLASCEPEDGFDHLHPAELLLALGCAEGDAAAVAAFTKEYGPDIDGALRRFRGVDLSQDDLRQALSEKLFVAREGKAPKIAEYAGQGFLQNWVRITAVRTFTDLTRARQRKRESPEEELLQLADGGDLELSFLKKHYRAAFKQAFEGAVASLESGERTLLRQSVVRGLSIDQLAALYSIHRATAARRVQRAREALLLNTRAKLMSQLAIGEGELDSVMKLIHSRLDISIHRVLGGESAERAPARG
jgi:RNA polymerase sigma-70 factor (ECF subfamily)